MTVYIVEGWTGEYYDYYDWIVKAFMSKEKALEYKKKCEDFVAPLQKLHDNDLSKFVDTMQQLKPEEMPDPNLSIYYNGTEYVIVEVDVEE